MLLPVLGIMGYFEAQVTLSATGHRILEVGIVLVVFALAAAWLQANEGAMLREFNGRGQQAACRRPGAPSMLSLDFSIDTNSNGNGRHRPAWYRPETDTLLLDPEEGRDE